MLDASRLRLLQGLARRHARGAQEADDLLQEALILALQKGRLPGRDLEPWLAGTIRNLAATARRSSMRRVRREAAFADLTAATGPAADDPAAAAGRTGLPRAFVETLPASLRLVALLAGAGATRAEIAHVTGAGDAALRQRLSALRARWRHFRAAGGEAAGAAPALPLPFGAIRRALLPVARRPGVALASHDPDGHLIAFDFSPGRPHVFPSGGHQGYRQPTGG
jgi:DNA-directed RNA polymerase specialized sigma24 family protein